MKHDEMHDHLDPLAALRQELAEVAPSPAFAAGVRRRIDARTGVRQARWGMAWWMAPASAAVAVAVAVGVGQMRPVVPSPVEATAEAPRMAQSARVPAPVAGVPVPGNDVMTPPAPRAGRATGEASRGVARGPAAARHEPAAEGPDMRVITNQPAVLSRIWEFAAAARASLPEEGAGWAVEVRDVVVVPVEVRPVLVKWLVEPPPETGALPVIRRQSAVRAERSLQ